MFAFTALSFRSGSVSIIGLDISAWDEQQGGGSGTSRRPVQSSTYCILFSLERDWDGRKDGLFNRERNGHSDREKYTRQAELH